MQAAKITLIGMCDWWEDQGNEDFFLSTFNLPDSSVYSTNDFKSYLYGMIIAQAGELGCLYSDPDWFRFNLDLWSQGMLPIWQRQINVIERDYDPLTNYDRKEEWADTGKTDTQKTAKDTGSILGTAARKNDITGSPYTTESVSAYDKTTFAPDRKTENSLDTHETGSESTTGASHTDTESSEQQNTSNLRSGRAYGNIGVTTSQQMLMEELEVSKYASIFLTMTDDFIRQFMIMVY